MSDVESRLKQLEQKHNALAAEVEELAARVRGLRYEAADEEAVSELAERVAAIENRLELSFESQD